MGIKRVLKGIATGGISEIKRSKKASKIAKGVLSGGVSILKGKPPSPKTAWGQVTGGSPLPTPSTIGNLASGFRPPTPPGLPGTPPMPPGLPGTPPTPPGLPGGPLPEMPWSGQPPGYSTQPVGPGVSAPGSQPSPGNPPPPGFDSWEAYYQSILPPGGTNLRPGVEQPPVQQSGYGYPQQPVMGSAWDQPPQFQAQPNVGPGQFSIGNLEGSPRSRYPSMADFGGAY